MKKIKSLIWDLLNTLGLGGMFQLQLDSALREVGWFRSYRHKQSVDAQGKPLPWYTYPFIAFISERLKPDFNVFEYGSGNSTKWCAQRVKSITAVEHDQGWFNQITPQLPPNAKALYREQGDTYIQAIQEVGEKFNIVVVDGRNRVKCTLFAVNYLTPDGVIILDNSDRAHYLPAKEKLKKLGFRRLDFTGMTPIVGITTTTSVFYKDGNCLEI